MSLFSKDVGIDLGTANTLVYMKGKGIIMREPSVVAVDTKTDEVRCVGAEAKAVIGRTPGSIVAVRPLKDGVIADFDITANMLETFLKKACGNSMFSRPRVVICIPSGVTEVERRAVRPSWIDGLGHVNNERYGEFVYDALNAEERSRLSALKRLDIWFKTELTEGESFAMERAETGEAVILRGIIQPAGRESFLMKLTF